MRKKWEQKKEAVQNNAIMLINIIILLSSFFFQVLPLFLYTINIFLELKKFKKI